VSTTKTALSRFQPVTVLDAVFGFAKLEGKSR